MDQRKLDFIQDELQAWAKEVEERLAKAMASKKIGITDDLLRSLSYQVFTASGNNQGEYRLSFLEYGRMVDMNVGRGRKIESIRGNRRIIKGVRDKKFYSKTSYGMLNRLIANLVSNYQEQTIETIKSNLT